MNINPQSNKDMKKIFLYSVMAAFIMLFASCSQEEIVSENNGSNGKVTIMVGMPGEGASTRAMPVVDGKVRRCIMQVVDADGNAIIGEGRKQVTEVKSDTITFSFAEPTGEYLVVFWADYATAATAEGDYIYMTSALPTISYKSNKNTMFTAAGDAFCGVIQKGTTSVSLKRPFNKIVVGSTNTEVFGQYTKIAIGSFDVPDSYNILNKTTAATKSIRLETADMNNTETGEWTYFYTFAPVTSTAASLTLPITLSGAEGTTPVTFQAKTTLPTDDNMIGNIDIPEVPVDNTVEVNISFDDKFINDNEPVDPTAIKVGSYINAEGKVVTDASKAVAIVFATEALNNDLPTNYPEVLQDKTIKGYAVAVSNATAGRQAIIAASETLTFNMPTNPTNGTQTTEALLTGIGSEKAFTTTYNKWTSEHSLTGANLSGWYIPTFDQLKYFVGMLFKIDDVTATGSTEFKALPEFARENGKLFDREPIAAVNYASSTINNSGNISVMTLLDSEIAKGGQAVVTGEGTKATSIICRPFLTIFE